MIKSVMGLDLSTRTGISLFLEGKVNKYSLIEVTEEVKLASKKLLYPYDLIYKVDYIVEKIIESGIKVSKPDVIIIEETCSSRNVYAQKLLEWIHYSLMIEISNLDWKPEVKYYGSNKWRSILGILSTKEIKAHNKLVKSKERKGKITTKHLSVWKANQVYNLNLLMKHDNHADAIHLAAAYLKETGDLSYDYTKPLQIPDDRRHSQD